MATIKSYTDLSQSKTLSKILPIESADMYYECTKEEPEHKVYVGRNIAITYNLFSYRNGHTIPCWSLASLLNYLKNKNKFPEIKELSDGRFKLTTYIWDDKDCIQVSIGDSIVDACYEMIIKLKERNLI